MPGLHCRRAAEAVPGPTAARKPPSDVLRFTSILKTSREKPSESEVLSYCRGWEVVFACSTLYSDEGRECLDFFNGGRALNYGHNNPVLLRPLLNSQTQRPELQSDGSGAQGTKSVEAVVKLARHREPSGPAADDGRLANMPVHQPSNRTAPALPATGRHAALPKHRLQRPHRVGHGRHGLRGRRAGARLKN